MLLYYKSVLVDETGKKFDEGYLTIHPIILPGLFHFTYAKPVVN